ncbi:hypothetical protein VTN77DRAFT_3198 [Rasamsonia byssochlamydoides]|uniref:uncharacterized protein n=1 Tax=Rasamsonia byssochlamydoides TaxID=89139 RepID=UPI00374488EE
MAATKPPFTFTTKIQPPPLLSSPSSLSPNGSSSSNPVVLEYPTPDNPRPSSNPPVFTDAMIVRDKVFVQEQGCSAEAEIDADDLRSWHWVVYASPLRQHISTTTTTSTTQNGTAPAQEPSEEEEAIPVGVIRLVPPPHAPHDILHHPELAGSLPKYDLDHEPYIKITRVAVLPEFRGYGLSRVLMDTAQDWAAQHPEEINAAYAREVASLQDADKRAANDAKTAEMTRGKEWTGLVILHAQVQVEKMYERFGYETDKSMGVWDEEGIDHVGMFRRLKISSTSE